MRANMSHTARLLVEALLAEALLRADARSNHGLCWCSRSRGPRTPYQIGLQRSCNAIVRKQVGLKLVEIRTSFHEGEGDERIYVLRKRADI